MALAAYKSLLFLHHVLGHIHQSSWRWLLPYMKAIKTLQKQVGYLQDSLETHSNSQQENDQIDDLARQIAEFANEAVLIIDSNIVHKLCMGSETESELNIGEWSFRRAIEKVFIKIFWLKKELKTLIKEGEVLSEEQATIRVPAGPSTLPSDGNNNTMMVGFDEDLDLIMNELTGGQPDLAIIPITGMGGIGKTTLARNAFENKCVVEHFDVRVWITISQAYDVQQILLGVLRDIGVNIDDLKVKN
ncbi:hypothetical protein BUALT_Bualt07G0029400 [Buddleja alternifolia]|uniref:NB-ARC domain-containing protein n=1 Tax=Buddleja alternifolia TaxID=168488 RepID=A0AAV6X8W7_9LAMI|nr:hypothetical protein BUALT_Bualt07G0029400 [Buddleja alternifolia]